MIIHYTEKIMNFWYVSDIMTNLQKVIENGKIKYNGSLKTIYAHYTNQSNKERYDEHFQKVSLLFREFIDRHEKSFTNLFKEIKKEFDLTISQKEFRNYLLEIVKFHDIGKVNPRFQKEVLENPEFDQLKFGEFKSKDINPNHSYPSAVLAASLLAEKYSFQKNPILLLFPYIIWGHHTRLKNTYDHLLADLGTEHDGKYCRTTIYLSNLLESPSKNSIKNLQKRQKSLKNLLEKITWKQSSLSFFYNLLYSFLITADSIASSYAYQPVELIKKELEGILNDRINENILKRMKNSFEEKQNEYDSPKEDINKLRQEMFKKSHKNLEKGLAKGKRVFYLKMPTGGGKTNTSMGLALKLLEKTTIDRIIYALPYTNIIDQNYENIKDIYNLKEPSEIRKIYSGTETIFEKDEKDEEIDKSQILLDDDFYNYPVICTTNVSFFNSIVKFKKREKNRFSSLSNSVVILDEVQSLPADHWTTLNYLINEMAEKLNIYFVLMSATVPKLNKLIVQRDKSPPYEENIHHLIKNPNTYFEKFERNEIKTKKPPEFNLKEESSKSKLKEFLKSTIGKNLNDCFESGLVVVNTVKTSREIYEMITEIKDEIDIDFSLGLLNSTFLPYQKEKIIDKLNELEENEKFILVSTQSIEAGMDVDFGFVVRDFATLDSIEQVRGRCNRENNRKTGNIYLLKLKRGQFKESNIYDIRKLKISNKLLEETNYNYDYADVESYYEILNEKINEETKKRNYVTEKDNVEFFTRTKYEDVNYWKNKDKRVFHVDIIENKLNNFSFFVKTNIPLNYFSDAEERYLKDISKKEDISFINEGEVKGKEILEYYLSKKEKLRENREYVEKKIFRKEFGSILQKFIFQITGTVDEVEIKSRFGEKKEYFYIVQEDQIGDDEEDYFSLKKGFNKQKLKGRHTFII